MVKCPKCQATLPDFAQNCQFCGQAFTNTSVPKPPKGVLAYDGGTPKWVLPAYYGISGWWLFDGAVSVLYSLVKTHSVLSLIFGAATALIGLGLILRIEFVRNFVNILCAFKILGGIIDLFFAFLMTGILGLFGALMMIMAIVGIVTAGLMIFLIGETDTNAPNL